MSATNTAPDLIDAIAGAIYNGDANNSLAADWNQLLKWEAEEREQPPGYKPRRNKVDKYRRIAREALEALGTAWADPSYDENDPNAGHRFKISVQSAGSSSVVGDTDHSDDADGFGSDIPPLEVTVRAWNLRDALLLSLGVPLDVWAEGRVKYERDLHDGLAHPGVKA